MVNETGESMKKEKTTKLPPHNKEAEESILGAILVNPVVLNRIVEYIKPESFYFKAHKVIYETMLNLYNKGNVQIDILTVSDELRNQGTLEAIGGRDYINDLALNTITTANIEYYAKMIQEKAIKRQLIAAGSDIVEMAYENLTTEATLDTAEKLIFNIAQERTTSDLVARKDLVLTSFDLIE